MSNISPNRTLNHVSTSEEHQVRLPVAFRLTATMARPNLNSDRLKPSSSQTVRLSSAVPTVAKQPSASRSVRSAWKLLTSAAVVAGSIVAVYQPWKQTTAESHAAATHAEAPRKTVEIQRPTQGTTANVLLPATFRPWQTTALSARVSGYLTRWNRDLGDRVVAGEVLAEIETPELDQEVASAESMAREADAAVIQAKAERVEAQADLKAAEAQLSRVRAELELTRSQLTRREKLVVSRVITQEEFDSFTREVEARTAVVAAAESDVIRRNANLETRSAIIDARTATAKSRQSNVERLQQLQVFKQIVAPFDGTVTSRTAEVGMLVTAGRETLFVVEDMSKVRVQINVPQTYSRQAVPGVVATVSVPESSVSVHGTITRVSSSVDSASRTMLAEIELENPTLRLQPGSYAQVILKTEQDHASWTIPTNTVLMRVQGPHVAVVGLQDQIELRPVSLGRDLGSRVVVVTGINGDERLVVNPGNDLTNGLPIQISQKSMDGQEVAQR